jgi:hypothetical protein
MTNEVILADPSSSTPVYNSSTSDKKFSLTGNPLCHPIMEAIDFIASRQLLLAGMSEIGSRKKVNSFGKIDFFEIRKTVWQSRGGS